MANEPAATTIVVGIDGSPGSDEAVRWVAEHGPLLNARVTAVHVVSRVDLWDLAALQVDSAPGLEDRRKKARGEWTEPLRLAGLRVNARIVRGDPAMELLRVGNERLADLIVIGAKNHTGVRDIVLGGTAHKVANHARRPVLLVPAPSRPSRRKRELPDTRQVRPLL